MKKYKGPNKNFRVGVSGNYKWYTLKDGDVVPEDVLPLLSKDQLDAPVVKKAVKKVAKKKVSKK